MRAGLIAAILSVVLSPAPAPAQTKTVNQAIDEVLGDHVAYERLILAARKAVAAHDAAGVAALVRYPIGVTISGKKRVIRTPDSFISHYDAIVTPSIARAVSGENYQDLFVNAQGVMFGDGEMWISGVCRDVACTGGAQVKIVAIQSVK